MDAPLSNVLFAWIQRFRSPPFAKISILVATVVAWFCLAAISLGFVYELAFVKSSERFMGRKPLVENWTACWSLGFFLLNLWGYCCAAESLDLEILVFEERAPPPPPPPKMLKPKPTRELLLGTLWVTTVFGCGGRESMGELPVFTQAYGVYYITGNGTGWSLLSC